MDQVSNIRGQGTVTFCGREVKVKASFDALVAIEDSVGGDLVLFLKKMGAQQSIPVSVAGKLFYFMQKAAGERLSLGECGQLLLNNGFAKSTMALMVILSSAMTAGSDEIKAGGGGDPS